MKKRINEGNIYKYFSTLPSDLYRRFAKCFDYLLAPEIIDNNYINNCYVPCSLDEQLSEIYSNKIDGIYKLVGYTGIGKTTMICKNFELIPNRSVPIINGKTLIMPVFFDGDKILETDVENKVIRKIKSVCTKIKKSLNLKLSKEEYENKLYDFIYETKEELLEYEDNDIRYDDDERSKVSESIAALRKNNPNAYYLCELKMYLTLSEINNFIIVLDDLETQPIDIIMRIILEHLHIYECLKNSNRKYRIKLVMSSRPHTFRFLNDVEVYRRRLEAYGSNELTIETPPDINEIFRKRFEYASNNLILNGEIRVTNVTSWQNALSVLKAINNNIDLEFDKILYEINHYNIRETLVCYVHILCNRQWFQKNQNIDPSFILNEDDYSTGKPAVLKALIYGNNNIYVNNDIVPNILYTDYNCSNEMYSLLIIKHFVFKKAVARYGINNIIISSFLKDCNDLWDGNEDIDNKIVLCINDLIDKKILLYSVYEKEYSDKHIRFGENRKLYLSSKGLALWELLENDSILIEAYREDIYRDCNDFISDKKNIELPQETVLRDCLQYLKSFIEFETTLLNTVKSSKKSGLYFKLFGNKLISRHIYTGISNTIQYYYHSHGRSISNELYLDNNEVNEMIKSAEDII